MYAYVLECLRDDIKDLVNGKESLETFAEFYCVKRDAPAPAGNARMIPR